MLLELFSIKILVCLFDAHSFHALFVSMHVYLPDLHVHLMLIYLSGLLHVYLPDFFIPLCAVFFDSLFICLCTLRFVHSFVDSYIHTFIHSYKSYKSLQYTKSRNKYFRFLELLLIGHSVGQMTDGGGYVPSSPLFRSKGRKVFESWNS